MTETDVERIVDRRIAEVLDQLSWYGERASGTRMFQSPVHAITVDGCKAVAKEIMRKWFKRAVQ